MFTLVNYFLHYIFFYISLHCPQFSIIPCTLLLFCALNFYLWPVIIYLFYHLLIHRIVLEMVTAEFRSVGRPESGSSFVWCFHNQLMSSINSIIKLNQAMSDLTLCRTIHSSIIRYWCVHFVHPNSLQLFDLKSTFSLNFRNSTNDI